MVCNIRDKLKAQTFLSIGFLSNMHTFFPTEINCIGLNTLSGIFPIRGVVDSDSIKIFNTMTLQAETQIFLSGLIIVERLDL